ncbi:L-serine ammonia-lyase [Agaribacter flavus]|uniref:L-serine dehydratase n=1 Tax=Agaribacter flavus TaxID=1902781 RepID=A0ABV7FQ65_9ALTE
MISVFDMFSIGIGPSSSHTVGPMKAANAFVSQLCEDKLIDQTRRFSVQLFGSLGQTGKGHGTGKAVILGLMGLTPEGVDVDHIESLLKEVEQKQLLKLQGIDHSVNFPNRDAIIFHRKKSLPLHPNGLTFYAHSEDEILFQESYYSIGGGFIVKESEFAAQKEKALITADIPYPFEKAIELVETCKTYGFSVSKLMLENEKAILPEAEVNSRLLDIWTNMKKCVERGIRTEGILPGGLKVQRRAPGLYRRLLSEKTDDPMSAMDWVNLFALAVNEENAAGSRVVTAPTNGAAGIIPAVLCYYDKFIRPVDDETACRYLLTAAAIGILYKKNASISGAEVGCQGEVGVACSMAAGALTEIIGGSVDAVENAAEIGMEHNLGLTCDPVGGLVQVPCIERNAMGAIKAINASRLAMRGTGQHKVSLDKVIKTMWDTGNDMKSKYKETARGGLAVNIIEC